MSQGVIGNGGSRAGRLAPRRERVRDVGRTMPEVASASAAGGRWQKVSGNTVFRFFFLVVALLVFSAPFFTGLTEKPIYFMFLYYFISWPVIIALIFVLNIGARERKRP